MTKAIFRIVGDLVSSKMKLPEIYILILSSSLKNLKSISSILSRTLTIILERSLIVYQYNNRKTTTKEKCKMKWFTEKAKFTK